MLATFWGKVKQNPTMDWGQIKKVMHNIESSYSAIMFNVACPQILDLYKRKNLIISGQTELEFIFKIIPKTVKENLESANK